jgi:DNA polymerase-3 subunit gamma/tau
MSLKDKEKNVKKQLIDEMKNSEIFKSVLDRFPDAELIDVNSKKDGVDND